MTPQKPKPVLQGRLQVGQVFIWQYEVLQLLVSGGHAFVYRARHRFLGHMVAIRVLHRAAGVSLEMLRRGQAEAQIEFQLKHPGIVSVLDGGIDGDGLLYIVMELLQGRSMRDALIELAKLHVIEVLTLGARIARAIEVAHRAGVVHRDLKPENLFLHACEACVRTLEAALVQRGVSLTARELWRKTPSASGVEGIGTPSAAIDEHDMAPASRPPFFGGLSLSTATIVPRSKATAPPSEDTSDAVPKAIVAPTLS